MGTILLHGPSKHGLCPLSSTFMSPPKPKKLTTRCIETNFLIHPMITSFPNQIFKCKTYNDGTIHYAIPKALIAKIHSSMVEPAYYSLARKYPRWRQVMSSEFDPLLRNCIWTLVPLGEACNIIGSKWVFHIKWKVDGQIDPYKA